MNTGHAVRRGTRQTITTRFVVMVFAMAITMVLTWSPAMRSITVQAAEADVFNDLTYARIRADTRLDALKSKSAILIDAETGMVLFEKEAHVRRPIASVTKIMTMLLAMEALDGGKVRKDTTVSVSAHAASMIGSGAFLEKGQQHTFWDLLKAVAVASANDASVALAEAIAGTETEFVRLMNEKADALGMKDTHFKDCTGLTDTDHYSTAFDITRMAGELIEKHPDIRTLTTIWHDTFNQGRYDLDNTNKLIRYYTDENRNIVCDGLKTGFTDGAGQCMCMTVTSPSGRLISVVLGGPDINTRFGESARLMDHGLQDFEKGTFGTPQAIVAAIPVERGVSRRVDAVQTASVTLTYPRGSADKISFRIEPAESLEAPVTAGQPAGSLVYMVDGRDALKVELVAAEDVRKASWIRLFFRKILSWIGIGR